MKIRRNENPCREIGLLGEHEQPKIPDVPNFNGNLTAQGPMRNDDPEAKRLKDIFGDQIRFDTLDGGASVVIGDKRN